jgi:hypothetical protein
LRLATVKGAAIIKGEAGFKGKSVAAPIALEPNGRENLATTGRSDRMAVLFASIAWPPLPLSRWNGKSTIRWQPWTKQPFSTVSFGSASILESCVGVSQLADMPVVAPEAYS